MGNAVDVLTEGRFTEKEYRNAIVALKKSEFERGLRNHQDRRTNHREAFRRKRRDTFDKDFNSMLSGIYDIVYDNDMEMRRIKYKENAEARRTGNV